MKTILSILAIILLLSLVLNGWLIWDKKRTAERNLELDINTADVWRGRIDKATAAAKTAAHRADSLQASFENRHTTDSLALRALSVRNKAMSETVHKLRIPVQVTIDTMQALGEFVRAYDSLLAGKNEEIEELKLRHAAQLTDLQGALAERTREVMSQAAISEGWRQTAQQAQADVAKERRRKGFWKVTSGILTAGIIFMAVRE